MKGLFVLERAAWPLTARLPPHFVVAQYSARRQQFLHGLREKPPQERYTPPAKLKRTLWGLEFSSPILNAAGMFKNGESYGWVAAQGAGGYLAGTTTFHARDGNERAGIRLPFAPYRSSHAASNWLGLPNIGDERVSRVLAALPRAAGCPIGVSVMGSPNFGPSEHRAKLEALVAGMQRYEHAGVDFIEMNESCPNTEQGRPQDDALEQRLRFIKEHFLDSRARAVPVVVKFSNDTPATQVPALVDLLCELGFSGVNFGNTSTAYAKRRESIAPRDRRLYDYFTTTFNGGVSGRPLKEDSLLLSSLAVRHVRTKAPKQEFHVIRTGGIETAQDLAASERAGISLNQWYTGYFEQFARHGTKAYRRLYEDLKA